MKTHYLLFLALLLSPFARGSLYLEPRLAHLSISGTPEVGDLGKETSSDVPDIIPMFHLGWEITSRINIGVRYTEIDDILINKTASDAQIFPRPGGVYAQVLTRYTYEQNSQITSLALPLDVIAGEKLTVTITPLLQRERSHVRVDRVYEPYESVIANPPPLYDRTDSNTHFGIEAGLSYRIQKHIAATLSYTHAPLKTFDAHLVSAGIRFTF